MAALAVVVVGAVSDDVTADQHDGGAWAKQVVCVSQRRFHDERLCHYL
jgi:hypothetical protein